MAGESLRDSLDELLNSEKFKCAICKSYLSVAPILVLENGDYSCGRCRESIYAENSNPQTERQTIYEEIAKNLRFPCHNEDKGCQEILQWTEVENHEKNCEFGKIGCVFNAEEFGDMTPCKWRGTNKEYFQHLEQHARTVDKIDKLEIWKKPENQVIKLELINNTVLVILLFLNNAYHFVMVGKDESDSVKYKFSVLDKKEVNSCCFLCSSTYLPLTLHDILKFKLVFNPELLNPHSASIKLIGETDCECKAENRPSCGSCNLIIKGKIFTLYRKYGNNSNLKYCKDCASKPNYYSNSSDDEDCVEKFLTYHPSLQHYKCSTACCTFHGTISEFEIHDEFCEFLIGKQSTILKLNFPYKLNASDYFFSFDKSTFKLLRSESEQFVTLRLFSLKSTEFEYEIQIAISNCFMTIMTFAILPNFNYSKNNLDNSIQIPKKALNQYGNDIKFQVNISKF